MRFDNNVTKQICYTRVPWPAWIVHDCSSYPFAMLHKYMGETLSYLCAVCVCKCSQLYTFIIYIIYIYICACVFVCFLGKSWRDFGGRHPANFILPPALTKIVFRPEKPDLWPNQVSHGADTRICHFCREFLGRTGCHWPLASPSECWGTVRAVDCSW